MLTGGFDPAQTGCSGRLGGLLQTGCSRPLPDSGAVYSPVEPVRCRPAGTPDCRLQQEEEEEERGRRYHEPAAASGCPDTRPGLPNITCFPSLPLSHSTCSPPGCSPPNPCLRPPAPFPEPD